MIIRFTTDGPGRSTTRQNDTTTDFYRLEKEVKDLQIKYAKRFFFLFNCLLCGECKQLLHKSLESWLLDCRPLFEIKKTFLFFDI